MRIKRIRSKLLLGFLVVVVVVTAQGLLDFQRSRKVEILVREAYMASMEEGVAATGMLEQISKIRSALAAKDVVIRTEKIRRFFERFDAALAQAENASSRSLKLAQTRKGQTREQEELEDVAQLAAIRAKAEELRVAATPSLDAAALRIHIDTELISRLGKYVQRSREDMQSEAKEASALLASSRRTLMGSMLLTLIAAAIGCFLLGRIVLKPLGHLTATARAISEGDREKRFSSGRRDEFGLLASTFDELLESLRTATESQTDLKAKVADHAMDLNRFFDLSVDLMCISNFSGHFVSINRAFEEALGYTREQLLSEPYVNLIHPDDLAATQVELENYKVRGAFSLAFRNRYRHRDGTWRHLSWNAVPVQSTGLVYATARDITSEVVAAEAGIRRREQLAQFQDSFIRLRDADHGDLPGYFRLITEECSSTLGVERVGIWRFDKTGTRLECVDLCDGGNHVPGPIISAGDSPAYFNAIARLKPLAVENARLHPATSELRAGYLEKHGIIGMLDVPVCAGDNIAGVICCEQVGRTRAWTSEEIKYVNAVAASAMIAIELNERRAAEQQLRELNLTLEERVASRTAEIAENEKKFRQMISQVKDYAILMLDPAGHIMSWNAGAERTKGYTSREILGRHYSCFHIPEDQREGLPARLLKEAETDGSVTTQGWRLRKDGSRFWTEVVITAIRGKDGELQGFTKVTRDLTAQRATDAALHEALETQRELTRKAQAGERAKSEFLAIMSHEVRTPMNGILGFAEILANAPELSAQSQEYATTVYQSGSSLLRILDDILDFSTTEAGSMKIHNAVFSPRDVLQEVSHLLGGSARARDLELVFAVSEKIPEWLVGDAGRLRQILLNLTGNALKFTDEGFVTVSVEQVAAPDGSTLWRFSVKDSGCGIPQDQRYSIFEPFVQADGSSSRRHGGAGLGLAICKRLAELMGGTLELAPPSGKGTEFIALLPFAISSSPPSPDKDGHFTAADSGFAAKYPLDIMVVEDDPINRRLILLTLKRLGYTPTAADNGRLAVEGVRRSQPNCIIMDLQMPEMDGIEATRRIREFERTGNLKPAFIAAMTANTLESDRDNFIDAGISAYLNKPVHGSAMTRMLVEASHVIQSQRTHPPILLS